MVEHDRGRWCALTRELYEREGLALQARDEIYSATGLGWRRLSETHGLALRTADATDAFIEGIADVADKYALKLREDRVVVSCIVLALKKTGKAPTSGGDSDD